MSTKEVVCTGLQTVCFAIYRYKSLPWGRDCISAVQNGGAGGPVNLLLQYRRAGPVFHAPDRGLKE